MKNPDASPRRKLRLAYLVTHPIQYQAPLLRRVAREPDIDFKVFFGTDFSARAFKAAEFGRVIEWDVPLLDGYASEVLPIVLGRGATGVLPPLDFWRPLNRGLGRRLSEGGFDALWIHGYAHWTHLVAMAAAARRRIKVLLRDEATAISKDRGAAKRLAKQFFFLGIDRLVDAYLAIGTLNHEYYLANGIPESRIFPVPYAVDNVRFIAEASDAGRTREELRRALGLAPGRPILLFAAKLIERKRPAELIAAFANVHADPTARRPYLLLAGDGPLRPALEAQAAEQAPDAVGFLGFLKQSELPRYYDLCDAFILPSAEEAWGLVVNEVMCAGRAVIVSDKVGAGRDLVRPGDNGAIFRSDDLDDMSRAMREVLADPNRLKAMGQSSRKIIDEWSFEQDIRGLRWALRSACPGRLWD
jgi:glycosyltransferase involved in cell wall biosynthesis